LVSSDEPPELQSCNYDKTLKEELESKASISSDQSKESIALEVSYRTPLLSTRYFDQRDLADEPS